MQNADLFSNMPPSLAVKMQTYALQTAKKADNICRRYHVPQEVYEAFTMDAIDILRAQYQELRATTEQMQILTDAVPRRSWDKTENAPLCFIARYYADIAATFNGGKLSFGRDFVDAVVAYEHMKRCRKMGYAVEYDGGEFAENDGDDTKAEARRLYYTYAILIAAEFCDATEDELKGIQAPAGVILTDEQIQRAITAGLDFQRQRRQNMAARSARPAATQSRTPKDTDGELFKPKTLPEMLPVNKTIMQYQNIAYMQGNGIETADNLPGDQSGKMRPIWQSIAEQRQLALAVMADAATADADRVRAAELVADTNAAAQVLDGIQILPQLLKPISGSTNYSEYIISPREFYRIATGINSPNSEQILHFLRALAWIDTQRISVAETTEKTITERDSSGVIIKGEDGRPKRKKVQRIIVTNFRPVVITFRTEYEDKVPIEKATQLNIMLHKIIKDGRSGDFIEENGKRLYIVKPMQLYMKVGQYYQFTTEEERTFRAIILSKPKQAEDALLSAVFNYPKRQAEANRRAEDAKAIADEMQRNPAATDEQKQQAREDAEAARLQARKYITKHIGRDYEKLAGMFEKAQNCGLITYYCRRAAAAGGIYKPDKYGRGFVWEWQRPEAKDKPKRGGKRYSGRK